MLQNIFFHKLGTKKWDHSAVYELCINVSLLENISLISYSIKNTTYTDAMLQHQ